MQLTERIFWHRVKPKHTTTDDINNVNINSYFDTAMFHIIQIIQPSDQTPVRVYQGRGRKRKGGVLIEGGRTTHLHDVYVHTSDEKITSVRLKVPSQNLSASF